MDFKEETSSMQSWADREVEIACKRERADSDTPEGNWDYGCACYESALKAFKSLMGDGHSGFSIGLTKHILNRLIEGKPLTPIEDTPDIWSDISDISGLHGEEVNYQCKRMSSLFKYVYPDGAVKYLDVESYYGVSTDNLDANYNSSLLSRIFNEMWPITMPYYPSQATKFVCEEFLTDKKNGDFDTVGVLYAIRPGDEKVEVNRFFKDGEDSMVEIGRDEYEKRRDVAKYV